MDTLVEQLLKGESVIDENAPDHKQEVTTRTFTNMQELKMDPVKFLAKGKTDLEKVEYFATPFEWPSTENYMINISKFLKHPTMTKILLDRASRFLKQKNLSKALKGFNLAVAFSEKEDLAQVFSSRAKLLVTLEVLEEALRDIQSASKSPCSSKHRLTLEESRSMVEQLMELRKGRQSESLLKDEASRLKFRQNILFKVKQPNQQMPAAESFVKCDKHPIKGRRLYVDRDIPAGTVLVVEEPFVRILKEETKFDLTHCHFCFKRFKSGMPCPNCVFATYCDEKCLESAYTKYHKYECPCLPYVTATQTPRYVQTSLRIVCTLGPKELFRMYKESDQNYMSFGDVKTKSGDERSERTLGIDPETGIYSSDTYLPIYHLISHEQDPESVAACTNVIHALVFAHVLNEFSSFFDDIPSDEKRQFVLFVASILLHHIQNIPFNSVSVDEARALDDVTLLNQFKLDPGVLSEKIRTLQMEQVGSGTYAVSSLLNHSCDPNVTRVHDLINGRMALVASRPLLAGEEMTTSYSCVHLIESRAQRQEYLQKTYNFCCDCIACAQDWGTTIQLLQEPVPRFSCGICLSKSSACTDVAVRANNSPNQLGLISLQRGMLDRQGICNRCGYQHNVVSILAQYDAKSVSFLEAHDLILENRPLEAIRILNPVLHFLSRNINPPFIKTLMAQDAYKRCLDLIVFFSENRKC